MLNFSADLPVNIQAEWIYLVDHLLVEYQVVGTQYLLSMVTKIIELANTVPVLTHPTSDWQKY